MTPDRTHDFTRGEQRFAAEVALAVRASRAVPENVRVRGLGILRALAREP